MILDKKKELRARKSTNLSFLRLSQRWPILLAVIVLVVHVVAGLQEWLESLLAGPGARRRGHPWERISANVQDHTVELSAFWHVIRRIPTWSALLLPPFWLPFAPSIVPPPVVHLRGTGKGNLRRNPRLRRLWERNRGTAAAWNQRVPMCRSTPGFLSYSLASLSLSTFERSSSLSLSLSQFLSVSNHLHLSPVVFEEYLKISKLITCREDCKQDLIRLFVFSNLM